jgi:flagellar hook-basal body complex protein FliE
MDPVQNLQKGFAPLFTGARPSRPEGAGFQDTLKAFTMDVNRQMKAADQKAFEFAAGKGGDIHEVVIASEKAGVSFKLLMEIRNKLLDAYQEIMRMSF